MLNVTWGGDCMAARVHATRRGTLSYWWGLHAKRQSCCHHAALHVVQAQRAGQLITASGSC
jgi:hypothetical protein